MERKTEYPRPQFVRKNWQNLNGEWEFAFDDEDRGVKERWYKGDKAFDRVIEVPFVYQCRLSGICDRKPHDIVWYKKEIYIEDCISNNETCFDKAGADIKGGSGLYGERSDEVILHFGAVDYEAWVYVNGHLAGTHAGGYTPFSVDMTPYLREGKQSIVLRVYDPHENEFIPRGKQFWEAKPRGIWYTNSTGIWQTVWIECVSARRIENIKFLPLYDAGKVCVKCSAKGIKKGDLLCYKVSLEGELIAEGQQRWMTEEMNFTVDIVRSRIFNTNFHDDGISWTPENPVLFDIELKLQAESGAVYDEVSSYFGFRKIHTENGMVYLNNKPYYQKLILDQGYWPDGLLTAPADDAFISDIKAAKAMGFNGCRKHQKMEDPRFLYWADRLGFLVWGESAAPAMFSEQAVKRVLDEWTEAVERDYNHPSIVAWVPINESWGVPEIGRNKMQQNFSMTLYYLLHAVDDTRLVISNDGWEMTKTDICAVHNYRHGADGEEKVYQEYRRTLAGKEGMLGRPSACREIYAQGYAHEGEPIMLTEFGGISYEISGESGWGYTTAETEGEFLSAYERVMDAVYASECLWGFCYTQLTDVEQETNGLLTYDRRMKCDPDKIKKINDGYHVSRV